MDTSNLKSEYLKDVISKTENKDSFEPEFLQALKEVLISLEPVILYN